MEIKFENSDERKVFVRSLIVSVIVLIVGLGWAYSVGKKANLIDHELYHAQEGLEGLQNLQKKPVQSRGAK